MEELNLYTGKEKKGEDINIINVYAEIEQAGKTVDSNAQVTTIPFILSSIEEDKKTNPAPGGTSTNNQTNQNNNNMDVIDKINTDKDITMSVAGRNISMPATNWLLCLIAFLLFLILIFRS